jgi:hypothetical protein
VTGTGSKNQRQGGLLGALPADSWALGPIWLLPASGRCVRAEQKRIVLLLLRLLLRRRRRLTAAPREANRKARCPLFELPTARCPLAVPNMPQSEFELLKFQTKSHKKNPPARGSAPWQPGDLYTARARAQPPPPPRWGRAPGSNEPGGPRPRRRKQGRGPHRSRRQPTPLPGLRCGARLARRASPPRRPNPVVRSEGDVGAHPLTSACAFGAWFFG